MDVDVHLLGREVEEQRRRRVAAGGDNVAIRGAERRAQQRVTNRPAVHREVLQMLRRAGEGRAGGQTFERQPAHAVQGPGGAHRLCRRVKLLAQQVPQPPRAVARRREAQRRAALVQHLETDFGPCEREAAQRIQHRRRLRPVAAQELAPRRRGEEQVAQLHARARRGGGRLYLALAPALDQDAVRRAVRGARSDREPCDGTDRGQRLPAEA